ncbi:MAG: hypothetical protein IT196_23990, partial [Acidimicrobiales bacterium]|nr:hypothetical protein [Acidimicrobiales bacterium]
MPDTITGRIRPVGQAPARRLIPPSAAAPAAAGAAVRTLRLPAPPTAPSAHAEPAHAEPAHPVEPIQGAASPPPTASPPNPTLDEPPSAPRPVPPRPARPPRTITPARQSHAVMGRLVVAATSVAGFLGIGGAIALPQLQHTLSEQAAGQLAAAAAPTPTKPAPIQIVVRRIAADGPTAAAGA